MVLGAKDKHVNFRFVHLTSVHSFLSKFFIFILSLFFAINKE